MFAFASGGLDRTLDYWRDAVRIIQAYEIWQVYGRFVEEKHLRASGRASPSAYAAASKISGKPEADAARKIQAAAREHIRAQNTPGTVGAQPSAPGIAPKLDTPAARGHGRLPPPRRCGLTCIAGLGGLPQGVDPGQHRFGQARRACSFIGWAGGDEALLDLAVTLSRWLRDRARALASPTQILVEQRGGMICFRRD